MRSRHRPICPIGDERASVHLAAMVRARPLNSPPHNPSRAPELSRLSHWDTAALSPGPQALLASEPAPQNRLQIAPGSAKLRLTIASHRIASRVSISLRRRCASTSSSPRHTPPVLTSFRLLCPGICADPRDNGPALRRPLRAARKDFARRASPSTRVYKERVQPPARAAARTRDTCRILKHAQQQWRQTEFSQNVTTRS
jgi:hypothetical protein